MDAPKRFRVIAVRRNGQTIALDEFLTLAQAEKLRDSLPADAKFTEIRIEPEEPDASRPS